MSQQYEYAIVLTNVQTCRKVYWV